MKTIKFRGRRLADDKLIHGDLIHFDGKPQILSEDIMEMGDTLNVDPETVVQLVGYDKNGNEIYEGDTLIHRSGAEWIAHLGGRTCNFAPEG